MQHLWEKGDVYNGFWWGLMRKKGHLDNLGVDGSIILKWIFKKSDGEARMDWFGSGQGHVVGSCECGNVPSGSI
jgi:hypothetical protein